MIRSVFAAFLCVSSSCAKAANKQTFMVPMSDGAKLATDMYLPEGKGPFPVILTRTPYNKNNAIKMMDKVVSGGYVGVAQDMRGRFASEGQNMPFIGCGWADHQDGADTVAWLLKQEWCNGKIGTLGGSAGGITQNLMAGAAPKGLTVQHINVAAVSLFGGASFVGGAFRKEQSENWSRSNKFDPNAQLIWQQHTHYDDYWAKFDSSTKFSVMNVPAMHVGGWFDTFSQGTIDSFMGRQYKGAEGGRGKQKMILGPWTHGGSSGELNFPHNRAPKEYSEARWFEHYLKGVDNGMDKVPAVAYYVMGDTTSDKAPGNEWRYSDVWPIPATETPYYLHKAGKLTPDKPSAAGDFLEYVFDPNNPCPTRGGKNLTIANGPMNQSGQAGRKAIEGRKDVLCFSTDPLGEPVEVTGRVTAKVFVSSSAVDTDVSVRLLDVYPDGRSYEMAEGILRLRFREGMDREVPLQPGKVYEVAVDCWSTSIVFNRGHRMRVLVTSSNFPRFDANPGTGKMWKDGGEYVTQTNRIYCDAEHPSAIILPVIKTGK